MKPGSKGWKKFMAKLYGIGAAVVIIGALFKIMHWPYSGILLIVGLSTEAIIFVFSAFEPIPKEYDWSLVYDEFNEMEDSEELGPRRKKSAGLGDLDHMLEEAKITPELLENLGDGFRTLSNQASKLNEIADATVATDEYVTSLKGASSKVTELSDNYQKASESLVGLMESGDYSSQAGEGLQRLTANLNKLNEAYELQLQGATDHLRSSGEAFAGIEELVRNLKDSVEDTKRYKDNISQLSENLTSLNTVYGNMLAAMNYNKTNA
ncbi:type IX secretion system motor protein PorL/GldL [Luteibaculum oceani]|uniref:Gliding motility protein GldL n=1 Tax=Luteibaculum oceani TaxID=1294296 RepID=A0A5C6V2J4_9FLAO|nr:gliding motility protein GldL [Luteibaculum oceani]TXC78851.1 gliding motility protein GldL [Luteibaculum oceani]